MSDLLFTSFGTPSGDCGGPTPFAVDPHCASAPNTTHAIIASACLGKVGCEVVADFHTFGVEVNDTALRFYVDNYTSFELALPPLCVTGAAYHNHSAYMPFKPLYGELKGVSLVKAVFNSTWAPAHNTIPPLTLHNVLPSMQAFSMWPSLTTPTPLGGRPIITPQL